MHARRRLLTLCALALCVACSDGGDDVAGDTPTDAAPRARSVVLFTIDTLRADRLAPYGNATYPTPSASRLAEQSLVFDNAYSQADNTNPSVTSFLTGLVPPRHGVVSQTTKPRDEVVSLPAMLRVHGFATGSFVANLCKLQDVPGSVFREGWDTRFCGMADDIPQRQFGADCVDAGMAWIRERQAAGERFFAWIHLMDPHSEYDPPPEYWDHAADPVLPKIKQVQYQSSFEETGGPPPHELARINALYDAEVRGSDDQLGRMLDMLDALPGGDEIALLFSADHGEELYETWPRIGHGLSLTEGVLRVPLMLRAPGVAPGRRRDFVETLAITPTVLDLLDADPAYELDARSLLAGPAALPYARSYTWPLVVTVRAEGKRYWIRESADVPVREFAPWRHDAPWFQQRETLARYAPDAPTLPEWLDPNDAIEGHPDFALRAAGGRTLRDARGDATQLSTIEDSAYLQQLVELGYIQKADH